MSVTLQSYFVKELELSMLREAKTLDQLGELLEKLELAPELYDSSYAFVMMQFEDDLEKWLPCLSVNNQKWIMEFTTLTVHCFTDNNRYYPFSGECNTLDAVLFSKEELSMAKSAYENIDIEDLRKNYPRFPIRIQVNVEQFTRYLKSWYNIIKSAVDEDKLLLTLLG